MVEYIALMVGCLGLMFFMMELSFRIQDGSVIDDAGIFTYMDFLKIIILFTAFILGLFVVWFMMLVSLENGASAGLQAASTTLLWFWGVILFFIMAGIGIYFLWWIPNVIKRAQKEENKQRGT